MFTCPPGSAQGWPLYSPLASLHWEHSQGLASQARCSIILDGRKNTFWRLYFIFSKLFLVLWKRESAGMMWTFVDFWTFQKWKLGLANTAGFTILHIVECSTLNLLHMIALEQQRKFLGLHFPICSSFVLHWLLTERLNTLHRAVFLLISLIRHNSIWQFKLLVTVAMFCHNRVTNIIPTVRMFLI